MLPISNEIGGAYWFVFVRAFVRSSRLLAHLSHSDLFCDILSVVRESVCPSVRLKKIFLSETRRSRSLIFGM